VALPRGSQGRGLRCVAGGKPGARKAAALPRGRGAVRRDTQTMARTYHD